MKTTAIAFMGLALSACSHSPDTVVDAAAPHDLARDPEMLPSYCRPSVDPVTVVESSCADAPPNGYCFADLPNPTF
jgi:hypothetical protein